MLPTWDTLNKLKDKIAAFPPDPDGGTGGRRSKVISVDTFGRERRSARQEPPPARPYRYASLKGLTDEQITMYMGEGKQKHAFGRDEVVESQLPKGFWSLPPKQAALAFADVNRTEEHRRRFSLAVDDRGGRLAPESCSVYLAYHSAHHDFFARVFLRADPKSSYLAYTAGPGREDFFESPVNRDLRCVPMSYEDARHVAQTIYWLNRVRSWSSDSTSWRSAFLGGWSSIDRPGALVLTSGQAREVEVVDSIPSQHISGRFGGHYGAQNLLLLADYLIRTATPERLGKAWKDQAPLKETLRISGFRWPIPQTPEQREKEYGENVAQARAQVPRILGLFSADGSRAAHYLMIDAVDAVGDFTLAEFVPQLKAMQKELPPPAKPVRTYRIVDAEHDRVWAQEKATGRDRDFNAGETESMRLFRECQRLVQGIEPEAAREELRQAVELALRKIGAAGDIDLVAKWAASREDGCLWALGTLRRKNPKRYVEALEWWMKHTQERWARQIFDEIRVMDEGRARTVAGEAAGKREPTVAAWSALEKARAMTDREARIDALIAIALDPKNGWEQRGDALELLVPQDNPLQYPDRRIDEALAKILEPARADDTINYSLQRACEALVKRGRVEYFDAMLDALMNTKVESAADLDESVLNSVLLMAQTAGDVQKKKVRDRLSPNLLTTGYCLPKIIFSFYCLDRREVKGDLERIATAGPEDYEGERAYSSTSAPGPVTDRFHAARKVLALWNEQDPLTRGKLLVAFGFEEGGRDGSPVGRTVRAQLRELAKTLPAADAAALVAFTVSRERAAAEAQGRKGAPDVATDFGNFVRATVAAR